MEKAVVKQFLEKDCKNYHVWSHRHWVLKTYQCWEGELDFVEELLTSDIRNNSAWNHRHFVISSTTGWDAKTCSREVEYARGKILKNEGNESAWNYLRGVLKHAEQSHWDSAEEICKSVDEDRFSLGLLVEILRRRKSPEAIEQAIKICEKL